MCWIVWGYLTDHLQIIRDYLQDYLRLFEHYLQFIWDYLLGCLQIICMFFGLFASYLWIIGWIIWHYLMVIWAFSCRVWKTTFLSHQKSTHRQPAGLLLALLIYYVSSTVTFWTVLESTESLLVDIQCSCTSPSLAGQYDNPVQGLLFHLQWLHT